MLCEYVQLWPSYGRLIDFTSEKSKMAAAAILKMAAAAILDFSEVKSDITGSRGLPVSTSRPNLVKISLKAPELWQFMCFQNDL